MATKKQQESDRVESNKREERLLQIIEHAYNNSPAIKEKFDRAGIKPSNIKSSADMGKIPITTKDEIIAAQKKNPPFGGFLAIPANKLIKICVSPGPIYVPVAEPKLKKYGENNPGIRRGDIILNTFSSMAVAATAQKFGQKAAAALFYPWVWAIPSSRYALCVTSKLLFILEPPAF